MDLYKNWPEICKIGYRNKLLMLVLASAVVNEDDDITQGLYVGFPQCFSTEKIDGPFPLSVIRELAAEKAQEQGVSNGAEYPDTFDVLYDLGVPTMLFEVATENERETDWPLISPNIVKDLKQGDVCEWKEKRMIVLENNLGSEKRTGRICLAPAECIALDL